MSRWNKCIAQLDKTSEDYGSYATTLGRWAQVHSRDELSTTVAKLSHEASRLSEHLAALADEQHRSMDTLDSKCVERLTSWANGLRDFLDQIHPSLKHHGHNLDQVRRSLDDLGANEVMIASQHVASLLIVIIDLAAATKR